MPCYMLEMPRNALACDLAQRLKDVVDYVGQKCNDEWVAYYGGELMDSLIANSQPADGSECLAVGHASAHAACKYQFYFF